MLNARKIRLLVILFRLKGEVISGTESGFALQTLSQLTVIDWNPVDGARGHESQYLTTEAPRHKDYEPPCGDANTEELELQGGSRQRLGDLHPFGKRFGDHRHPLHVA